jgi:hypothetical protein
MATTSTGPIEDDASFVGLCRNGDVDAVLSHIKLHKPSEEMLRRAASVAASAGQAEVLSFLLKQNVKLDLSYLAQHSIEFAKASSIPVLEVLEKGHWDVKRKATNLCRK